jgi:cytochrome c peroxidase
MRQLTAMGILVGLWLAAISCRTPPAGEQTQQTPAEPFVLPAGLETMPIPVPADNPMTKGKIALGEQLFFDTRLSGTKKMSCETCHVPEKGWTDGLALSPKFDGNLNTRHTPTLYGAAYYPDLYWDGRAKGLDAQILAAWRGQMGGNPDEVSKELEAIPGYQQAFQAEFGGPPTGDRIVKALAAFVRTIHAGDTPWDRQAKDPESLKQTEIGRGFLVFSETAKCTLCHLPPLFSDTLFHNIGIGFDTPTPDMGRGKILADAAAKAGQDAPPEAKTLMGAFKTPSLRGVALTAPYFHDGRATTLEETVDLILTGGIKNPSLDEKLQAWTITPAQRSDLLAFLRGLTPEQRPYPRPTLPPGSRP